MKGLQAMRYLILAVCFLLAFVAEQALGGDAPPARDWRFRPSYFTHQVPQDAAKRSPLPPSRSAYRPAAVGQFPGFSVRGGFRINRIQINSGNSSDSTYLFENWFRGR